MTPIDVVIVNWRRPANVDRIVPAFRNQTSPCRILLCDLGGAAHRPRPETLAQVDERFTWSHNYGSFNRLVPSFALRSSRVLFHDDDMVPGNDAVRALVEQSLAMGEHGVLGQMGRVYRDWEFNTDEVSRLNHARQVDNVIRSYLLHTDDLEHVFRFHRQHGAAFQSPDGRLLHDDLLLSLALRVAGRRSWVCPYWNLPETMLNKEDLPETEHAISLRPEHTAERCAILRWFRERWPEIHSIA